MTDQRQFATSAQIDCRRSLVRVKELFATANNTPGICDEDASAAHEEACLLSELAFSDAGMPMDERLQIAHEYIAFTDIEGAQRVLRDIAANCQ